MSLPIAFLVSLDNKHTSGPKLFVFGHLVLIDLHLKLDLYLHLGYTRFTEVNENFRGNISTYNNDNKLNRLLLFSSFHRIFSPNICRSILLRMLIYFTRHDCLVACKI